MNVFNLISAGGGSGSGLYIWKKNEVTPSTYVSHFLSAGDNAVDAYLPISTSYTVYEWNSIEPNADGSVKGVGLNATIPVTASSGGYYLQYGKYYTIEGATTGEAFATTNPYSADQTYISRNANNGRLWFGAGGISTTKPINYYSSQNAYTFVDYAISDDENAYPNGGTQGGYYYEKVTLSASTFGYENCEAGTITPTTSATSFTISHNLGVIPRGVLVCAEDVPSYSSSLLRYVSAIITSGKPYYGVIYNGNSGNSGTYGTSSTNATTTQVTLTTSSSGLFDAGVKYNYIIFA